MKLKKSTSPPFFFRFLAIFKYLHILWNMLERVYIRNKYDKYDINMINMTKYDKYDKYDKNSSY